MGYDSPEKLKDLINEGIVAPEIGRGKYTVFEELESMGIKNLEKLDEIIPKDFSKKARPFYLKTLERTKGGSSNFTLLF